MSNVTLQSDPIELLVCRVARCSASALDEALSGEEIGYPQWLVLSLIDQVPEITARQISDQLDYDTGALSRTIEFLFERGLIERRRCSSDRRFLRLTVTQSGQDCSSRCRRRVNERRSRWLRHFCATEEAALTSALSKLAAAIRADR